MINRSITGILIIGLLIISAHRLDAQGNERARVRKSVDVLEDILEIPEEGIPPALLEEAYGVAVIPGVLKVGLGVGGRHGKGVLSVQGTDDTWSPPLFISLSGGSVGWQIGVQSTDIILVFKNRKSVRAILDGEFTLGADASIAAGPVGRHVGAKTDVEFSAEIYSYSKSRGLFAGIALEGAVLQIDWDANEEFYDNIDITTDDIFKAQIQDIPRSVKDLQRALAEATNSN